MILKTATIAGLMLGSVLLAAGADADPIVQSPAKWNTLGQAILKQLIEIDSTHAHGSTVAAKTIADRLIAAGFPKQDVTLLAPPDHPTKGNVVVRLHGSGKEKPLLLIGHLDVVDAPRDAWSYDPFKLTEKDGWYYGRGTIDMKGQDAAVLTSLLRLKQEGFVPDRDIIAAFTADEEAGGDANGVDWLVKTHRDLVDAAVVINPDAGFAAIKNGRKLYLTVETSEKIYLTFAIEATDKGGHSSRPTPANPIYHIAGAVDRLSNYRFPLHLTDTTRQYLQRRAEIETGQVAADMRSVAGPSPDPAAEARLSSVVETNVVLRTTCTATQFSGGEAESALPEHANATIQCRVVPGETQAQIAKALTDLIADPAVKLNVVWPLEPSPESPPNPRILSAVEQVTHEIWPGVPILPEMGAGASDSAYTRTAGLPSYGIDGIFTDLDDYRAHGRDERIGIEAFAQELEFTYRLMKVLSSGT